MIPQYPNANAVESELKNANELDMITGLLNFVKRRYTIVPRPAPKIAAGICVGRPMIVGTAIVAAMIASTCWKANTINLPKGGLSLTS